MRAFILVAAVCASFTAYAQPSRDANPRAGQNTQGADASQLDEAAKERLRAEGAAGGTGARISPEASGGATVGNGSQHRHWPKKPPDPQQAERRDESSSDREAARGARGPVR